MQYFSMIPLLYVAQIWLILRLACNAGAARIPVLALIIALTTWGGFSTFMALSGVYDSIAFLHLLPGLWLPVVPFLIVTVFFIFPTMRKAFMRIADTAPAYWLVAIQGLRILAIGTLIKTIQGQFPLHVELAIGVIDIAYGLSALIILPLVYGNRLSADALVIWHLVGTVIIIIPGEIAIQSGLPGPFQVFSGIHSAEPMLDFPMVLAPSLVVPIFLLLNILGALSAFRRSQ